MNQKVFLIEEEKAWDGQQQPRFRMEQGSMTSDYYDETSEYESSSTEEVEKEVVFEWKDTENIRLSRIFEGHEGCLSGILLYENLGKLVTSSYDKTIRIWDFESCKLLKVLEDLNDWNQMIKWKKTDKDETFLSCCEKGLIVEFSILSMKSIRTVHNGAQLDEMISRIRKFSSDSLVCVEDSKRNSQRVLKIQYSTGNIQCELTDPNVSENASLILSKKFNDVFYVTTDPQEDKPNLLMVKINEKDEMIILQSFFKFTGEEITLIEVFENSEGNEILVGGSDFGNVYFFDTSFPDRTTKIVGKMDEDIFLSSRTVNFRSHIICFFGTKFGGLSAYDLKKKCIILEFRPHHSDFIQAIEFVGLKNGIQLLTASDDRTAKFVSITIKGVMEEDLDTFERENFIKLDYLERSSEDTINNKFFSVKQIRLGYINCTNIWLYKFLSIN